jgi:hypothetical protein
MSLSPCSRMWQWSMYRFVPLTRIGRSNGEWIVVTTAGLAETLSLKPSSSDAEGEAGSPVAVVACRPRTAAVGGRPQGRP